LAKVLDALKASDSDGLFTTLDGKTSDLYLWEDMIKAVNVMATEGIGDAKLWIGEGDNSDYGMVNIAAFLGQCMQETIQYNACDENNWSDPKTAAKYGGETYSSASACGQAHQSYQDYKCSAEEDALAGGKMSCDVDPDMEMRAHTQADWYGAPTKMFCAPKSKVPKAPKWNYMSPWCPPPGGYDHKDVFPDNVSLDVYFDYVNSGGGCQDYTGIKSGGWDYCGGAGCAGSPAPLFGHDAGRTDVEGCCWWGRGVIQSTGTCNFGKLNYYMGKRAQDEGRTALYPKLDFCKNPGAICDPESPPELKWISGFFYWLNSVQTYADKTAGEEWEYLTELKKWVDAGMSTADTSFIDGASGLVNRGCWNPPACGTGELDGGVERAANFAKVLGAMKIAGLLKADISV
jgi:predicted chitinase